MLTTWKNKEKQYINNQKGLENEIKRLQSIIKLYEKAFGAPPL